MNTMLSGSKYGAITERHVHIGVKIIVFWAVITIAACTPSDRRSPVQTSPARIEREILALMEDWHIPGISMCVIEDGEIVWNRGLGVRSFQTKEPIDQETVFQAASMSKPVFAYAVLRMHDEGLLDLDTPLLEYAPKEYIETKFLDHPMDAEGFEKEWFSRITARMALSHSSGLQHFGLKKPVELLFEPGTDFYYSSNGIEYLRYIVEHLAGKRIDTLIAGYVFEPLGMKHSSFSWREEYASNSAPGHDNYGRTSGGIDRYPFPTAQASLYTNARDYGKFVQAVMNGEGLEKETFDEMMRPQARTTPDGHWGLGFGLEILPDGKGIWHWGDGGTHTCYVYVNMESRSGFVYFVNSYYGLAILDDIFALVFGDGHPAPSFTAGDWSFRDDYLSPSMRFQNRYFNGQTDTALAFYRLTAGKHEKGMQFVDEISMQYWASDLLRNDRIPEAVDMLQLLVEAYYPDRSDTCRLLSARYHRAESDTIAAEYIETANKIIESKYFFWTDAQLPWMMDRKVAELKPISLDEEILLSYTGIYDPFEITYENGVLYFSREGTGSYEMLPINESTFMLKGVDYLKIQFIEEKGNITAAKGTWSSGRTKLFERNDSRPQR